MLFLFLFAERGQSQPGCVVARLQTVKRADADDAPLGFPEILQHALRLSQLGTDGAHVTVFLDYFSSRWQVAR
jgi:hypothetical protein